jgi:hypothetical protein
MIASRPEVCSRELRADRSRKPFFLQVRGEFLPLAEPDNRFNGRRKRDLSRVYPAIN